jgi:glyoxylase-like metal-dependent hydrolase (beta-lactamase superfamily II)
LITHFHSDHTGSLRALWEMTDSQIPVYAHDGDIAFIQENKKIYEQKSKSFSFTLGKNLMKLFPQPKLQVPCSSITKLMHCSNPSSTSANELQQEASTNNEASSSSAELPRSSKVHFYHCPGHTPGSCCFYHVEDQALICGDVFMNNTGRLGDSLPMATPDPVGSRQNAIEMCKTLDFNILLPSHDISEKGVFKETVVKHLKL